jgi:cyclophilin family peptidyl-prolyl cis-trans isomerase
MSNNNNINEAALPIVTNSIADVILKTDTADTTINLFENFDDPSTTGKVARFELYNTSFGGGIINVLLFDQSQTGAPLTVQNFINYASGGDYTNSIIHRSVKDFIIQGGGFTLNNLTVGNVPADPPVNNEFSIDRSNLRGTIAMAKLGNNPNSATNQWFFNLNNNSANLDNQNGGFTVFGQVLSQTDLNVIDAIAALPVSNLSNVNPAFRELPIISTPIDGDDDLVRFKSITVGNTNELTFNIVSNSNPNLVNATINNNQLFLDYGSERSGRAEIKIQATNLLGFTIEDTFIVGDNLIKVNDFQSSISGFNVNFDRQLNSEIINLYDGGDDRQDSSDLQVLDTNNQEVRGSLILDLDTNTLSFIKTGRSLQNGGYTVNLFSRDDSFVNLDGGTLDGNNDNITGDDYTNNLTIDNGNLKILGLPDFSRAPRQPVNLDRENSRGIPIGLSDGSGVTQLEFTLTYDADLLGINGVNLAANLVDSWQIIEQDFSTAGIVKINIQGSTSLNAGENDILSIAATVPETATYGASAILKLKDVKINGSSEGVIGDDSVQHVALLGDISGNGEITSLDAALSARIALGLDSGSDRFANIDPIIFGDSNFDRNLNDLDAATIAKSAVGLID